MKRHYLSKEEKETIWLTSEADETFEVYTFNLEWKRKLKKYSERFPDLCRITRDDRDVGSMTFIIQKSQVSIRLLDPISDQRRDEIRELAKKNNTSREQRKKQKEDVD